MLPIVRGPARALRSRPRALAGAALALLCLIAADVGAGEMVALPPRAPDAFATVARGASEWVRSRFAEAGFPSEPKLADGLPIDRARPIPARSALADLTASGVDRVWVLELDVDRGAATLALTMLDPASGAPVAAGRAETPLADLGAALASVADGVLTRVGSAGTTPKPPSLAELGALGRAVERIEAGQLADAWRELGPKPSSTSEALRKRIDELDRTAGVPIGARARLAAVRGESERARIWLRTAAASNQDDPVFALASAEAAEEMGDSERALPLYDRAIELDAASTAAQQGRARTLVQLGRVAEAVQAVETMVAPDPALIESLAEVASLDAATRSRLHLRAAQLHEARFDPVLAEKQIERAAQLDETAKGAAQREAALLHTQMGRPAQALPAAQQAVELGAADAPLLAALGEARLASKDTQGARQAFEQAHALAPEDIAPLRGLGEIALGAGDNAGARELFGQVLALAPQQNRTRLALAGLMRATGQVDDALEVIDAQPGGPTAELLREAATIRAGKGDTAGATQALEQARELAPANPVLLGELAKLRESGGDAAGAQELRALAAKADGGITTENATELGQSAPKTPEGPKSGFGELATSFPQHIPGYDHDVQVVALLAPSLAAEPNLLERWLLPRRIALDAVGEEVARALGGRFEVVAPHEIPHELAVADQQRLRRFDEDEPAVARMNEALGTDAVFVARVRRPLPDENHAGSLLLEVRMGVGGDPLQVRRFANQTWIEDAYAEWNPASLVIASLLLVLAALPLLRGWGELQVGIQYASLGKGFFSIKLSRTPTRAEVGETRASAGGNRYLKKMRMMGRFERAMVGKETLFRWLPARRYYVTVHGLLQDASTGEVVGNYAAEQAVVLERGKTKRLDFDFRAREATLEVGVFNAGEPIPQATVALRGQPSSLRYARGGSTMLYLAPGTYRVLIATEDSVWEREIAIEGFAPRSLSVDVQDENAMIFRGCVEAVEPYLTGNLLAAADALEQAGDTSAAANVRGEHFAAIGDTKQAAKAYQRAGRLEDAASLLSTGSDAAAAGELFEQAGNHEKAAKAFESAGQHQRAAAHYEAVYRYEDAVECYRRIGDVDKVAELLEKLARYYEAARTAIEAGDADRAIRNLQMIDLRDPDYVRASQLLGEIFLERGEHDLAVQKLDEAITVGGGDNAPLELVEQLARAFESAGKLDQALGSWETIRARDFHYPEAATKIESLRHAVEAERATRATLATSGGAQEESRYEILGEVGRGGMGVVFKARDKRLGRVVALKRLPDNLRNHPTAVRLFLREARAAAALNHRNIVTLFDAGQEGDQYFLTMELLEGYPLADILTKRGKLSARDAARLGAQTCAGLEYAHAQGIVHRDIKTSNLFFTKDRVLKIMDFGLAKMTEEVRRAATVVGGTPYYMAPEQAAGEEVDHRADQYALGVTLFELVTGDVPFKEGDVTYHHRHSPPPDPRRAAEDLPEDFAALILKLMAKRREDRFDKTGDAGALLQKIAKRLSA